MLESILRFLFSSRKQHELLKELKKDPNFIGLDEPEKLEVSINSTPELHLKSGEIQSIFAPDLGNQKDLILTKWFYKQGDFIKPGDVICEVSNKNIMMEFESVFSGKLIFVCNLNQHLTPDTIIFKVEGT